MQPWRVCSHCGRTYENRQQLFDLYAAIALLINADAVIDEEESIDFCPQCGEDFDEEVVQ